MLLAAQCHLGTKNCTAHMERYVYRRRNDGVFVFDLGKTWEKLQLAARVIVAIENPQDIVAISARPYGQRGVLKFGAHTGAKSTINRHTPGGFTNQIMKGFEEPRLLVVTDPRTDHQAIREGGYMNIPVIAFCDTDSELAGVDIAIPANNKGKHAVGVLYYLLTRMVLQMRGAVSAANPWDVMVDMFFYREPEEVGSAAALSCPIWQLEQKTAGQRKQKTADRPTNRSPPPAEPKIAGQGAGGGRRGARRGRRGLLGRRGAPGRDRGLRRVRVQPLGRAGRLRRRRRLRGRRRVRGGRRAAGRARDRVRRRRPVWRRVLRAARWAARARFGRPQSGRRVSSQAFELAERAREIITGQGLWLAE